MSTAGVVMTSAVCRRSLQCTTIALCATTNHNPMLSHRIVDDEWSRLLTARLLHSLLTCDINSAVALQVVN
jgi:hypothetical protein